LRHRLLREPFVLRIASENVLERSLQLPPAARGSLAAILGLELERQSPIAPENVYYDYFCGQNANRLDVTMRIVRRETVDRPLATCRAAGLEIARVVFAGAASEGGNLPADARAAALLALRRRLVPALAALTVAFALGLVTAVYIRGEAINQQLRTEVAAARREARTVLELHRAIDAAGQRSVFLARMKQRPMMLALIAETTRLVPEGSWLSELQVRDNEVRITGYSRSASSLIGLIDRSPMFTNAQFRSPLLQSGEVERFEISFELRKGAPR